MFKNSLLLHRIQIFEFLKKAFFPVSIFAWWVIFTMYQSHCLYDYLSHCFYDYLVLILFWSETISVCCTKSFLENGQIDNSAKNILFSSNIYKCGPSSFSVNDLQITGGMRGKSYFRGSYSKLCLTSHS